MKKLVQLLSLAVMASVLLGAGLACNTTEGMGKDIKKGGANLEDAADRNK